MAIIMKCLRCIHAVIRYITVYYKKAHHVKVKVTLKDEEQQLMITETIK